jgi:hypothetical protein
MHAPFVCVLGLFALFTLSSASAAVELERAPLAGHLLPTLVTARPVAQDAATKAARAAEPIALTVVLRRTDVAGFERFLADVYDRASPRFRQFLSPVEVSDRFGPSLDDYAQVRAYFTGAGLVPLEDSSNRLTLRVMGTRAQVERVLDVAIDDYQVDDTKFRANDREPTLPKSLAGRVHAIMGLSDLAAPSHLNSTFQSLDKCIKNAEGIYTPDLQIACALIYGVDAAIYDLACAFILVVLQIELGLGGIAGFAADGVVNAVTGCHFVYPGGPVAAAARKATATPRQTTGPPPALPGTGQKVGIVAFDSFLMSDVADFIELVGSPPGQLGRISEIKLSGGAPLGPDQDEVLIDIGQVIALSPGAQVDVYSMSFALGSFQSIFNRMLTDGVDVVSNSWTYCEKQTSVADLASVDSVLASMAASGISVFNASGDTGTTCLGFLPNSVGVPSGSPNATAVGGSSYTWGPAPLYGSETWWDGTLTNPDTGQGGYGTSEHYPKPGYQAGVSMSAFRSVPDVVAAADPVTNGKPICQASKGGCPSGLFYGGTSVAAPLWAAIIADLNAGLPTNIGFLNPQIYPLAGTPALHGAAELSSDFARVGLGSPNAAQLYLALGGVSLGLPTAANTDVVALPVEVAADGISTGTVVVQLRDSKGLPVPGKTVSLAANAGSQAQITPAMVVSSSANGAVQFSVTDTVLETVTVSAFDVTDNLQLDSAEIRFVSPPATAGSISAFPTTVAADGAASTTITVTLQGAQGQPVSGKTITINAGTSRAIVAGPSPPVTNAMGQVTFTAANVFADTTSFTAVDVTDGNLPVPGAAVVDFVNPGSAPCAVVPVPAAGYTVSSFATGFTFGDFSFGGVNWGGCPGASNPTFDTNGNVLVANFRTGDIFRFGLDGGAATSEIANGGITLGQPTFGLDGRVYATHGSTGAGGGSGDIVELDPVTGATLRVVASSLRCPGGLSVDPISGDLFFTGTCFGGGLDDARLFRVTDPSDTDPGRPTAVVTYATMPASPGGATAFAPDGTLYMGMDYDGVRQVWRVDGTDKPQPAAIAQVPGVGATFWVNVAEANPDGSAKSLIVLAPADPFPLQLVDISVSPPVVTTLVETPTSSGTIGPDGCLYIHGGVAVYKLSPSNGACRFRATNPTPALALSPPAVQPNPDQGTLLTFSAQLHNALPTPGQYVVFQVTGANYVLRVAPLDANGRAEFSYIGLVVGTDTVFAHTIVGTDDMLSNPARITWNAGAKSTVLDLNPSEAGGIDSTPVQVRALLRDTSASPPPPIVGAMVDFSVGGQTCSAMTNSSGIATCGVVVATQGTYTLTAEFDGSPGLLPSSDSRLFFITPFAQVGGIFRDGFENPQP